MAASWNIDFLPASAQKFSTCSVEILRGLGISPNNGAFVKTYYNLPIHHVIHYQLIFVMIDNWVAGDTFSIQFDTGTILRLDYMSFKSTSTGNLCGSGTIADFSGITVGRAFHSGDSVTVKIILSIAEKNNNLAAFAFYDFSMQFVKNANNDGENTNLWGSTSCSLGCERCYGPSPSQCYKCAWGHSFDGSECRLCGDSLCAFCFGDSMAQCSFCSSSSDVIFFNDDTCKVATTPYVSPFQLDSNGNTKVCKSPCKSGSYLLPDGYMQDHM